MDQRLCIVTLAVDNLERSRRFYEEGLGWQREKSKDNAIVFQLSNTLLELFPKRSLAEETHITATAAGIGVSAVRLSYCTQTRSEVDAVLAEAAAAGAMILKPAHEIERGGYAGYFADPDGHPWEIACHPKWAPRHDGKLWQDGEATPGA